MRRMTVGASASPEDEIGASAGNGCEDLRQLFRRLAATAPAGTRRTRSPIAPASLRAGMTRVAFTAAIIRSASS
ncbi:MAG: hypothetical protein DME08_19630 [Candidatus Rokuibacteriota bacterium]|nr:MAG: hypothetical protein DME08_19630 [Candidatus Rokubacteria bacterium]